MIPAPIRRAVFALACAVILWLCLAPSSDLPRVTLWDKAEHATAYMGLALIGAWAFPGRWDRLAIGLIAGGVGVEFAQAGMGWGRHGDPLDALANSVGVVAGLALAWAAPAIVRRFSQR